MTDKELTARSEPARVVRSRRGRVLGGVCAGIARALHVDPVLVRIAAVVLALATGGSAVLAYLVAWVLIPSERAEAEGASLPGGSGEGAPEATWRVGAESGTVGLPRATPDVRDAWNAAAGQLRALGSGLKPAPDPTREVGGRRSPVDAVDSALTGIGERLRDPEVQAAARRTAAQLSAAVNVSAEAISRRTRRGTGDGPAGPAQTTTPAGAVSAGPASGTATAAPITAEPAREAGAPEPGLGRPTE